MMSSGRSYLAEMVNPISISRGRVQFIVNSYYQLLVFVTRRQLENSKETSIGPLTAGGRKPNENAYGFYESNYDSIY